MIPSLCFSAIIVLADPLLSGALSDALRHHSPQSDVMTAKSLTEMQVLYSQASHKEWVVITESSLLHDLPQHDPGPASGEFGTDQVGLVVLCNRFTPIDAEEFSRRCGNRWALLSRTTCTVERLVVAVDTVRNGLALIDPNLHLPHNNGGGHLDAREQECLALVAQGLSNQSVAKHLFVSEKTVERALRSCYRKLGLISATSDINPRVAAALHYHGIDHTAAGKVT